LPVEYRGRSVATDARRTEFCRDDRVNSGQADPSWHSGEELFRRKHGCPPPASQPARGLRSNTGRNWRRAPDIRATSLSPTATTAPAAREISSVEYKQRFRADSPSRSLRRSERARLPLPQNIGATAT